MTKNTRKSQGQVPSQRSSAHPMPTPTTRAETTSTPARNPIPHAPLGRPLDPFGSCSRPLWARACLRRASKSGCEFTFAPQAVPARSEAAFTGGLPECQACAAQQRAISWCLARRGGRPSRARRPSCRRTRRPSWRRGRRRGAANRKALLGRRQRIPLANDRLLI